MSCANSVLQQFLNIENECTTSDRPTIFSRIANRRTHPRFVKAITSAINHSRNHLRNLNRQSPVPVAVLRYWRISRLLAALKAGIPVVACSLSILCPSGTSCSMSFVAIPSRCSIASGTGVARSSLGDDLPLQFVTCFPPSRSTLRGILMPFTTQPEAQVGLVFTPCNRRC